MLATRGWDMGDMSNRRAVSKPQRSNAQNIINIDNTIVL